MAIAPLIAVSRFSSIFFQTNAYGQTRHIGPRESQRNRGKSSPVSPDGQEQLRRPPGCPSAAQRCRLRRPEYVLAAIQADGSTKAALVVVVVAVIVMSVAEIPLQPIGLSMVTSVTPPRLVGLMIGVWLLNYGIGGGIGNALGSLASTIGIKTVFAIGAASCLLAGALVLALRQTLIAWLGEPIDSSAVDAGTRAQQQ